MYPGPELLQEVGRVTIAGSRLDVQMGWLWWHLDPHGTDDEQAREAPGAQQADKVRRLAREWLRGDLHDQVMRTVDEVDAARSSATRSSTRTGCCAATTRCAQVVAGISRASA